MTRRAISVLGPAVLALVAAGAAAAPPPASGPPQRIVSINLCTDILALQLGARLEAVSLFAADPRYSPVAEQAAGLPATSGRAEDVFRLRPDHVLAGRYTAAFTVRLLRQSGIPVTEIEPANGFAEIRRNVRIVAAALGRAEAGEAVVRRLDAALARLRAAALNPRRRAVIWLANGYTSGKDSLYTEVMNLIGLDNVAAQMNMGTYGFLTVEQVLRAAPDVIIRSPPEPGAPALAVSMLSHRALRRYARGAAVVPAPGADWYCGTPHVAAAARRLLASVRSAEVSP